MINASGGGSRITEGNIEKQETWIAKNLSTIRAAIKRSINTGISSKGSITITVKRFLTGVTVKEWDSILILNDVESPEAYYQAIFRVQSPWVSEEDQNIVKKPDSWVFDFSISRCLVLKNSINNLVNDPKSYEEEKKSLEDISRSFFLNKYIEGNLDPEAVTPEDIFSVLNTSYAKNSLARRIVSEALIHRVSLDVLNQKNIREILKNIKGYRKQTLNKNIIFKKLGPLEKIPRRGNSSEKRQSQLDKHSKKIKDDILWASEQLLKLSISMTDFIYMTQKREDCIDDVLNTTKANLFKSITGISKKDFQKLCDIEFIKKEKLNQIVRDFKDQETISLKTEDFITQAIEKLAS